MELSFVVALGIDHLSRDVDAGPDDLLELMEELREVVGWYDVGIYLNVPRHVLETIRKDHQTNNEQKHAMFSWWLDNALEKKKWSSIVRALSKTGYRCLATTIAYSHSECLAQHSDCESN